MNTALIKQWYFRKVQLADDIVDRHGAQAELDAEVLLCCATSALAARMWPGKEIDQKRFIQFLVDYAPPATNVQTISIVVLETKLKNDKDHRSEFSEVKQLHDAGRRLPTDVITANHIDRPESDIAKLVGISLHDIRRASYASIIYHDLRCGLVHEGRLTDNLTTGVPCTQVPIYENLIVGHPDPTKVANFAHQRKISETQARAELQLDLMEHRLYLPYSYVKQVLVGAAEAAFKYWDTASEWDAPKPAQWWADGPQISNLRAGHSSVL